MQVIDFYRATYSQNEIDLIDNKISDYRELAKKIPENDLQVICLDILNYLNSNEKLKPHFFHPKRMTNYINKSLNNSNFHNLNDSINHDVNIVPELTGLQRYKILSFASRTVAEESNEKYKDYKSFIFITKAAHLSEEIYKILLVSVKKDKIEEWKSTVETICGNKPKLILLKGNNLDLSITARILSSEFYEKPFRYNQDYWELDSLDRIRYDGFANIMAEDEHASLYHLEERMTVNREIRILEKLKYCFEVDKFKLIKFYIEK